jgi:DNA-binding NarL/FixJ family response regulator
MGDIGVLVVGGVGLAQELVLACRRRIGVRVLGPVHGGAAAAEAATLAAVDLAVVDLDRPEALRDMETLRDALPGVRVLAATDVVDPERAGAALGAGASGLLARGGPRAELVDAIRRAAAGEVILNEAHLRAMVEQIHLRRSEAASTQRLSSLTARERQVLALLSQGGGTAEIAVALGVSRATVQAHVKSVLRKFGVHSKVEAIRMAWRLGEATPVSVGA